MRACPARALEALIAKEAAMRTHHADGAWLGSEIQLLYTLDKHLASAAFDASDATNAQLLQLWRAFLRTRPGSSELPTAHAFTSFVRGQAAVREVAARALSAAHAQSPALRGCALPGCAAREVHPTQFKRCAARAALAYCCKAHQVEDWPRHKAACKAACKAAAAAAEQASAGPSGA
jgi:hypothetical protein